MLAGISSDDEEKDKELGLESYLVQNANKDKNINQDEKAVCFCCRKPDY